MTSPLVRDPTAIEKARQVFRFLKEFAERNVPKQRRLSEQPWSYRLAELPDYPSIKLGEVAPAFTSASGSEDPEEPLLRVGRPTISRPEGVPPALADWIQPGWEDPNAEVRVVEARNVRRGFETVTEAFSDNAERVRSFEQWRVRWDRWAAAERPARAAMKVFERLYELRSRIELESERVELMLGDGLLRWRTADGEFDHPILLQRVELVFDPEVPELRLVDADRPPELYSAAFGDAAQVPAATVSGLRTELENAGYHPLAKDATSGFLKRLAQQLSPRGEFRDDQVLKVIGQDPVVSRDAALFLRLRVSGFPAAFDRVLEDLEERKELPPSLTRLVGVTPPANATEPPLARSPWGEPPDVLLSKPANPEQVQIARALEQHSAVLVQGPPGTGKSHTIANLIGHLVAHGKRVLVTSHTTKALRVLRGQLVESLQPLCVAVLDNDLEARAQMEQSVRGILSRLTTSMAPQLEQEVADIAVRRSEINTDIEGITFDLAAVRQGEYRPVVVAGESILPADAGRWVKQHRDGNDWIPAPIVPGAPMPLDPDEVVELYSTASEISAAEESEIAAGLPDLGAVPPAAEFDRLVSSLSCEEPGELARFWDRAPHQNDMESARRLADVVTEKVRELSLMEPWQRAVVAAGHGGGAERDLWIAMGDQVREAGARWDKARATLLDYEPSVGNVQLPGEEIRQVLGEIVSHLELGGSLGVMSTVFRAKWRAVIAGARVNGGPPTQVAHFRALGVLQSVEDGRRRVATRWTRQAEPIGLPSVAACGSPPEPVLNDYAAQFASLLSWWPTSWSAIAAAVSEAGFRWEEFRKHEVAKAAPATPFERDSTLLAGSLLAAVSARSAAVTKHHSLCLLSDLEVLLEPHRGPIVGAVRSAVVARSLADYEPCRSSLLDLVAKGAVWHRRQELLTRLRASAPEWARAIQRRDGVHGRSRAPGSPGIAWRWSQLHQEIERRAQLDEVRLTETLHQRRTELRSATADLIDRRAWLGQLRRTDLPARQALQGWADTQKKIGKGTGKRVPELQARARELLGKARDAVPVWIMPLSRVADGFDPKKGRFDVVIVDEASQADVQGLLCWYLGDRIAVVGDHEQVSPLAVGQQTSAQQALINQYLHGIPNNHLYDGTTSIYHLGRQCFGGTIALREHFRCVPDIIEFSNHLSYSGEIRPLRNPSSAPRPHVLEYCVMPEAGAERVGKANLAEARAIAALTAAMATMPEYQAKTFSAITLLGDEQADLIQDVTVSLVGAVELERRRFIAGNAAQFQGDERDVMLLSMVDVPTGALLPLKQTELFKQRYNVAASRAKDQMWLVHSLEPGRDLKIGDLRRALIEHARDPSARHRELAASLRRSESPLETEIITRLVNAGYRVEPQVSVGRYRIDMVIIEGDRQVALECDGDRFHGMDQIPADMVRQAILERAGWQFVRVRGTRFFRDPERTFTWLCEELARRGVGPVGHRRDDAEPDAAAAQFRERVVRRAHEIMRDNNWLPPVEKAPIVLEETR